MEKLVGYTVCLSIQEIIAVSLLAAVAVGQDSEGPPEPYNFSYSTEDKEGSSSHEESSDGSGKVTGKYTLTLADGRMRVVSYWADESGFHADVMTNEQGMSLHIPIHE